MTDQVTRELFPDAACTTGVTPPRASMRMSALLSMRTPPQLATQTNLGSPPSATSSRSTRSSSRVALQSAETSPLPLQARHQQYQGQFHHDSDSDGGMLAVSPRHQSTLRSLSSPHITTAGLSTRSSPRLARLLPAATLHHPTHSQNNVESESEDSFFAPIDLDNVDLALNGRNYRSSNPGRQDNPDYNKWYVKELRAECSRRGVGIVGPDNKENRVRALELYDAEHGGRRGNRVQPAGTTATKSEPKRTKHCLYRLINVLTSNEFSTRFANSGNTLSRADVDAGAASTRLEFWEDVALAFRQDREEYRALQHEHALFKAAKINPGTVREHSAPKLRQLWRELNTKYNTALANSTKSGNHAPNFENYIGGNDAVSYLWMCLQDKANLISFVRGGMLEVDEYDSLRAVLHPGRSTTTPARDQQPPITRHERAPVRDAKSNKTPLMTLFRACSVQSRHFSATPRRRRSPLKVEPAWTSWTICGSES